MRRKKTKQKTVRVSTRITDEQDERLEIALAKRRLTKQAAVREAIERWLVDPVPISIISTPEVTENAFGELMKNATGVDLPSKTEQTRLSVEWRVLLNWLSITRRALTVKDRRWKRMLASIRQQLEIIAEHADNETGRNSGTG